MCVILVCPANVRPTQATLEACHRANPHGAGVAWREGGLVRWSKGLGPKELSRHVPRLPGEIVIHFRWASVGEVTPKLCHPFPITANANTGLTGRARAVLFHNGTWCDWRETLARMPSHRITDGPVSDTRVAASFVDLCGVETLERLPGRWVFFERDFTEQFGTWDRWDGMKVSNLIFTHHLPGHQQGHHKLSAHCGNPDTRNCRK